MARRIKLDFTGVESFKKASEGDHVCKIVSAEVKQSQGGNDMIVVAFEVTKGEDKTARVYENYPLLDTTLWKLKGLLEALGMKADSKVSLDLDKLIGKVCIVAVVHEEYDGKIRARVDEVKKFSVATTDDDDEDDYDDTDEVDDEAEEEEAPKKPEKKATKKAAKKPAPVEEDEDDWEEEEEDEEEEKPAPKKAPKKASKPAKAEKTKATDKKAAKKPVKAEESEDDDDDWDDDDWDE